MSELNNISNTETPAEEIPSSPKLPSQILDKPLTQEDVHELMDSIKSMCPEVNSIKFQTKVGSDVMMEESWKKDMKSPNQISHINKKNLEETKKLMDTFRERTANYPKYISYEGSMVLCVLLSLNNTAKISINNMPTADVGTIKSLLPDSYLKELSYFEAEFDKSKDFNLRFEGKDKDVFVLNMFNSVAHPRPQDLKDLGGDVPVEKDGDKIAVGGMFHLNSKKIQKLVGVQQTESLKEDPRKPGVIDEECYNRRQPVSGRNAYEIRADVLQMALDYMNKSVEITPSPDSVIDVAKKFYSFVENKRY